MVFFGIEKENIWSVSYLFCNIIWVIWLLTKYLNMCSIRVFENVIYFLWGKNNAYVQFCIMTQLFYALTDPLEVTQQHDNKLQWTQICVILCIQPDFV